MTLTFVASGCAPPDTETSLTNSDGVPIQKLGIGDEFVCDPYGKTKRTIDSLTCSFGDSELFVAVSSGNLGTASFDRMSVEYPSQSLGTVRTSYAGPLWNSPFVAGARVDCGDASSQHTETRCKVTLAELVLGNLETSTDASGEPFAVHRGSRVRIIVSCPTELYSGGADDYGPSPRTLSPNEFVLEATDCRALASR